MVPACTNERPAGLPLPFWILAAFLSSSEQGGVLRMKVNERSSKTEISTGMTVPAWSDVRALYSLQNIIMLTPAAPSAGPTGGAGLTLPAWSASLMIFVTFFAIIAGSAARRCAGADSTDGRTADADANLLLLLLRA